MELLSGGALAWQQYRALLRKNATLTWRNRRSAALQLFSSLVFIFLIFCIDRAVRSRFSSTTAYRNVPDPEPLIAPPIPPCEDKFFIKSPCYDFLWSDGGSDRIRGLVDAIRNNNPGRPIPPEKVPIPSATLLPPQLSLWIRQVHSCGEFVGVRFSPADLRNWADLCGWRRMPCSHVSREDFGFSSHFFESRNLDSGWGMIGFQFRSEFFFQRQRKPRDNFLFDTGILHEFRGFGFGILNKFISS
jgi:hypothetical protein